MQYSTDMTAVDNPARPGKLTWLGLALVMPSAIFWLAVLVGAALRMESLAAPFLKLVDLLDVWFVVGVLILMPLAGGILGAIGFRRQHMAMNIVVMLLGFAPAALTILMQTAPPPAH